MLVLPHEIEIVEVAPRDGLQSFPRPVDTATKIRMVNLLSRAGLRTIEVTSFAHPEVVPHLADAERVMAGIERRPGTVYRALVPNARGAERALAAGADELLGLAIVSRTYLRRNQNMERAEALDQAVRAFALAEAAGRRFVMALGMAFWCPYEGLIPEADVMACVAFLHRHGVRNIYLAGSVGLEDPRHVSALFARLRADFPECRFGYHIHDRGGFAPANILAALDAGVAWLEGAVCGLGGGIAMPDTVGDAGNYPTEDLVNLCAVAGIASGLDLQRIMAAASEIAALLDISPRSRALNGGTRAAALKPVERAAWPVSCR
ncbi:hydroxymethylglutaryl-CoA lyase [Phreatobacter sp. AB_2022a]|uniref:hydroxymethylglutaryl-CoA lyase n=1 Tax=Phreatobacter sp. AB_2022a TaxID=3003134 RepID=UPI002286E8B1|nr:hydroxymethylglutaryl-CoA lyase [Phreatobacter sp. AB_2022a]MCZ0732993.1 hydroxymethylglutaryl-CoA lyase [Phreatobacter sp. AB_2022a]